MSGAFDLPGIRADLALLGSTPDAGQIETILRHRVNPPDASALRSLRISGYAAGATVAGRVLRKWRGGGPAALRPAKGNAVKADQPSFDLTASSSDPTQDDLGPSPADLQADLPLGNYPVGHPKPGQVDILNDFTMGNPNDLTAGDDYDMSDIMWAGWEYGDEEVAADLIGGADDASGFEDLMSSADGDFADMMDNTINDVAGQVQQNSGLDATVDDIQQAISKATDPESLAGNADRIAVTETTAAMNTGATDTYASAGDVHWKAVVSAGDNTVCDLCDENEAASPIRVTDDFPNGDPPTHPNCRCAIEPSDPPQNDGTAQQRPGDAYAPITAQEARGNSRPVSADEFQRLAQLGKEQLDRLKAGGSPASLSGDQWDQIKAAGYQASQTSWGGITVDSHTGKNVGEGTTNYAMTIKDPGQETVSVPEGASQAEFNAAMDEALSRFSGPLSTSGAGLGVFHDDDNQRIDIDPVLIVPTLSRVESIGAYTHAIGGAYSFADGNGYWPPHVADTPAAAAA